MVGLLDFFTGGDPEQMAQIDPRYGVPRSDVRNAAINTLGNVSALLLAAGQPIMPAQRAQLLAQIGPAAAGGGTDLYNAAQRRLMTAQMDQRRADAEEAGRIGELMRDPDRFRAATGFELSQFQGMRPSDVAQTMRQVRTQQLTQDPNARALTELQVAEARRTANMPRTMEAGGVIYQFDEASRRWSPVSSPRPQGGLEGEAQSIVLQGARNPQLADTPEYAIAFTRLYGERTEIRNGEIVQIMPPVPPGIPRPTARAMAAAGGAAGGAAPAPGAPQPAAAPAAPAAPQDGAAPAQPAPAAPAGGETRTVTTPGGGQVSVTTTQPRALTPAEVTLRQETEATLSSARAAQAALQEALRINPTAYAGPGALQRATAAGLTGLDRAGAEATTLFNSIMTEQALGQLRAIFGGNPTEGERKILMDMGASVGMSRTQREALVRRALAAVEERIQSNERRLGEVVRGQYGRAQPDFTPPAAPAGPPPPPAGFEMVR